MEIRGRIATVTYSMLLPVLGGIYPVIFLYGYNAKVTPISSLVVPLIGSSVLALAIFGLFYVIQRSLLKASLSAFLFMIFFHTYGMMYSRLLAFNKFQVEHYTLLPLIVLIALYGSYFISKIRADIAAGLQKTFLVLSAGLVLFNLVPVVQAQIGNNQQTVSARAVTVSGQAARNAPDIYFIIFDEYAGFDALREYWKYDGYKEFITFLEGKGFYVAEHSRSYYTDSLYEISSRLNLTLDKTRKKPAAREAADYQELFQSIADNKVMQLFKSYGYSTVAIDGLQIPYKTKPDIHADFNFKVEDKSDVIGADEFTQLLLEQTMMSAFPLGFERANLPTQKNRDMIQFSLDKVEHLEEVPSPKFVYLHVMLPHLPLLYDQNGWALEFKDRLNWNYYLGQHKYATKRAKTLVDDLLRNADPNRPPVIILQSDHGARNLTVKSPDHVGLENYDEKYKHMIMNAVYLPGYDYSTLTKDLSPYEPLAIVLNHYLSADVRIKVIENGQ